MIPPCTRSSLLLVAVLAAQACSDDGSGALALAPSGAVQLPRSPQAAAAGGHGAAMADGAPIGLPYGPWQRFCAGDPGRVRCESPSATVALTPERWDELERVQRAVNAGVVQRPDDAADDRWTLLQPGDAGDCEDIALTKRDALIAGGWPAGALRPAVCYGWDQPAGGDALHTVMTVETDAGTFVLGNLDGAVRPWTGSECRDWVMRSGDGGWRWIAGGRTTPLFADAGG